MVVYIKEQSFSNSSTWWWWWIYIKKQGFSNSSTWWWWIYIKKQGFSNSSTWWWWWTSRSKALVTPLYSDSWWWASRSKALVTPSRVGNGGHKIPISGSGDNWNVLGKHPQSISNFQFQFTLSLDNFVEHFYAFDSPEIFVIWLQFHWSFLLRFQIGKNSASV